MQFYSLSIQGNQSMFPSIPYKLKHDYCKERPDSFFLPFPFLDLPSLIHSSIPKVYSKKRRSLLRASRVVSTVTAVFWGHPGGYVVSSTPSLVTLIHLNAYQPPVAQTRWLFPLVILQLFLGNHLVRKIVHC